MLKVSAKDMLILFLNEVFKHKYNYQVVLDSTYANSKEIFLYNEENSNYQLIRLSASLLNDENEDNHLKDCFNSLYYQNNIDIEKIKFLDIRLLSELPTNTNFKYDTTYIVSKNNKTNVYGINLDDYYPSFLTELGGVIRRTNNFFASIPDKRNKPIVTYIIIILCLINYGLALYLQGKYDASTSYILLGADYKTFTLGLKQFYRLFTMAFSHGSIIHLFCNMFSLYSLGSFVEKRYGRVKYIIILTYCIILGSLTTGILNGNNLNVGISGGLYGLLFIYFFNMYQDGIINPIQLFPTLIANIALNFMPNVAWQAHFGGLVGGIVLYYLFYGDPENHKYFMATTILLMASMIFKYVTINTISPFYGGTDIEVIQAIRDFGFKDYATNLMNRLIEVYSKYGG